MVDDFPHILEILAAAIEQGRAELVAERPPVQRHPVQRHPVQRAEQDYADVPTVLEELRVLRKVVIAKATRPTA